MTRWLHAAAAASLVMICSTAGADEGMWTFHGFPFEKANKTLKTSLDQAWLDRVRSATVAMNSSGLAIGAAFFEMTSRLMSDPSKLVEAQMSFWNYYLTLWQRTTQRMLGAKPVLVLNDLAPQRDLPDHGVRAVPRERVKGSGRGDCQVPVLERVDPARVLPPRRRGGHHMRAVPPYLFEDRSKPPPLRETLARIPPPVAGEAHRGVDASPADPTGTDSGAGSGSPEGLAGTGTRSSSNSISNSRITLPKSMVVHSVTGFPQS